MSWNNVLPGWIAELMSRDAEEERIREQRKQELESYWQYPENRNRITPPETESWLAEGDEEAW
jgi:hypothetical protein